MSDTKGQRAMTLADFIKVFDFEQSNLSIAYFNNQASHTYFSKDEVEREYCAILYTVVEIRPVNESTVHIIVWR